MRLFFAVIAALLAVFVVSAGLPATAARAASAPAGDGVTMTVEPASDGVLRPDDDLTLGVTVTNDGDSDLAATKARIYLDREPFTTRSKLASWLDPDDVSGDDYLGRQLVQVDVPAVSAGSSVALDTVVVPADRLSLTGRAFGARALGARVLDASGSQVAQTRSSVVWYPADSFQPTRVAVAVPITTPESETGVLDASALAAYTSDGGVLRRELDAVSGTGATLGVDPMIVASIRLLGTEAPQSAVDWLAELQALPNDMFPLAYADADVAGLRQAGATSVPAVTSLDTLVDPARFEGMPAATDTPTEAPSQGTDDGSGTGVAGSDPSALPSDGSTAEPTAEPTPGDGVVLPTTAQLLDFPWTQRDVVWPRESSVVSADLTTFAAGPYTSTIVSSGNVDVDGDSTENAAVTVGGVPAVVSDDPLSTLVTQAAEATSLAEWQSTMARLSATVATVAYERPSDARTLLTTLEREWPSTGQFLTRTLQAVDGLPWVSGATLTDALASTPSTATVVDSPESDARLDQLSELVSADQKVVDFSTALAEPQFVTETARLRTMALASHAWRDNVDGFPAEVASAVADATATSGLVAVVQGSPIAILGDRSALPLYLENRTDSVATVMLNLTPSNSILSIERSPIEVTIQPQSQTRVSVPVQSVANGTVSVQLQLVSLSGVAIATPVDVPLSVQAGWETAITWIFGVAFAALFLGGLYRTFRKRRRARDEARSSGDGPSPDAAVSPPVQESM
ncbi:MULTISPECIES: DUF6049 family protein [unclassified Frigoribacterium]|uniref:DUF6049 family protein n=1 Tax=unclassified Frigoribacterium TaxID=2627005 RepID=UPI0012EFF3F7|nr:MULTISPECIES: DUF6049 family protein [unclassified Frigoribacterium]WAC52041.1 DUF6049 family protein [Frigoribacterium sp. SL97]VXB99496.1 conserved exported hypothetical protein [Frigoribacterium sp. 9N]